MTNIEDDNSHTYTYVTHTRTYAPHTYTQILTNTYSHTHTIGNKYGSGYRKPV